MLFVAPRPSFVADVAIFAVAELLFPMLAVVATFSGLQVVTVVA